MGNGGAGNVRGMQGFVSNFMQEWSQVNESLPGVTEKTLSDQQ